MSAEIIFKLRVQHPMAELYSVTSMGILYVANISLDDGLLEWQRVDFLIPLSDIKPNHQFGPFAKCELLLEWIK